jgi:acrylyl-CoA reductase (NADPH)
MTSADTFRCFLVDDSGARTVSTQPIDRLPAGDVLIRSHYSSLNYKDALAAMGHRGVVSSFPHVPGIDVAGEVLSSTDSRYSTGDQVLVTGYELGAGKWGGWSELVRVPADWIIRLPAQRTPREAMIWGTAGFTAAQCVAALQLHSIEPTAGEVLVTGATGGVGSLAVAILAKLGYQVVAVTGKPEQETWLRNLGATRVLPREAIDINNPKPMLRACWAAVVDTVGGAILATVIKQTQQRGCVATCGNVAGTDLPLTVFPFILRGVKLDGIDSAQCPHPQRLAIWDKLFGPWRLDNLEVFAKEISLEVQNILSGKVTGRVLINTRRA